MKLTKKLMVLIILSVMAIFAAACSSSNETSQSTETNGGTGSEPKTEAPAKAPEAEKLEGSVLIDGSSTVFPIMEAVTEEYRSVQPEVEVTVGVSGSGGGFEKFVRGETDLSNASRPIKDEEATKAKEAGIEFKELELAYDGLSVVVSKENEFLEELTIEQLRKIFLAESGATKWSDVDPTWPNETIKIFSPGHDSGTFDYFNEVILEEKPMREDENVSLSENDDILVTGISSDKNAIGFFGYAYYIENQDKLKVLAIENKDGEMVKPTQETIQSKKYNPLSRPLFTYVKVSSLKEKPHVLDFTRFTLNNAGAMAEAVGYVGLPAEKYDEQLKGIEELAK